jgi:hypothetical protein
MGATVAGSVQSVVLRRLNKILVGETVARMSERVTTPKNSIATFNLNLQALGYTLSPKVIQAFQHQTTPVSSALQFSSILETLKEMKGVRNYKPMYPNFPKQVIEASDAELYINAIIHYFSFVLVDLTGDPDMIWLPTYVKDKREPLTEKVQLRVLDLATEKDAGDLFDRIATSNTSISATDKEDLRILLNGGCYGNLTEVFPAIKNKENLAFIGALLVDSTVDVSPYFKTTTDVLRLATALSNGDVSLTDDSKFKSFKNSERRYLLGLMEPIKNKEEDMLRWTERWLRLGERLHPGTFAKRFPTTFHAFRALRNNNNKKGNKKIVTFRSQVEAAVRSSNTAASIKLLVQRPGDFARRLDHVLREAEARGGNKVRVVDSFLEVAHEVSTPVLLQVMSHFEHRPNANLRVVLPKGNVAKVMSLDKPLPLLNESYCANVVNGIKEVLAERFSALPKLGKVYIDPALKDCLVPFSQRSASKTLRTLVRGSKLAFGNEKDTLRFFIWWHDIKSEDEYARRVDLDLSAVLYDADWKHIGEVAFYNLRVGNSHYSKEDKGCYAVHSGDITSAPKGASEFIDINIPKAVEDGIRYVVMSVHGYTSQNFCDLPECFAGFMLREKPQSGEVYDPRTVEDRADLAMAAQDGVPLIIDLVDRKVIWADAAINPHNHNVYGWRHTVASTRGTIELLGKAFTSIKKPNLYDLFSLHAKGRGKLVMDESKADVVFSVKAGTPFELDRIASEFMVDAVEKPKKRKAASAQ